MARLLDQIVGHETQKTQLREALARDRLPSTLLFVGPSGIGKKRVALGVLQILVCDRRPARDQACGECPSCVRVEKQQSENLLLVEPDGTQIKMEQAQDVLRFFSLAAMGKPRAVILNEAQNLNPQAANALLKFLEEPPELTHSILIAPSTAGLLPTIRSRAQVVRFSPLTAEELSRVLYAPDWVLRSAQGRVELAARLMEPEWAELRDLAFQALGLALENKVAEALETLSEVAKNRELALAVTRLWQQIVRDALLARFAIDAAIHADRRSALRELAGRSETELLAWARESFELENDILANVERSLSLENFFYKLHRPGFAAGL